MVVIVKVAGQSVSLDDNYFALYNALIDLTNAIEKLRSELKR